MARIIRFKLNRNSKRKQRHDEAPTTVADLSARLREEVEGLEVLAKTQAAEKELPSFMAFERALKEKLDAVGCATTELFLTHAEERVAAASKDGVECGGRLLRPAPQPQARNLTGRFGVVRYFRTYLRENHRDAFVATVHDRLQADAAATPRRSRLRAHSPAPLPAVVHNDVDETTCEPADVDEAA